MIAGCYTLHLYCDNYNITGGEITDGVHKYNEFPKVYIHELGSTCRRLARKDGWTITRDGRAYCPKCTRRKKVED